MIGIFRVFWFVVACAVAAGSPTLVLAATPADPIGEQESMAAAEEPDEEGWWQGWYGAAAPDRVYAGAWTLHLKRPSDGWSQHSLVAIGWRGVFAGTFTNSHGGRSWALGLARDVIRMERMGFAGSLGYRAGVIRGYDERLHEIAGRWPVLPGMEIVGTVQRGRLGVTAGYAGIVTSVGGFVSLGSR